MIMKQISSVCGLFGDTGADWIGIRRKLPDVVAKTVAAPSLPSSNASVINKTGKKILVTYWGGSVSQVTVNGFGIGIPFGSVLVEHGHTVGFTYTAAPTWIWQAVE